MLGRLYRRVFPYWARDAGVPGLARQPESCMRKSMIGTRNGGPSGASQEARDLYADALLAQDKAWSNTAENIRVGFENVWITPALAAIEELLRAIATEQGE